jgi:hypothetical protein
VPRPAALLAKAKTLGHAVLTVQGADGYPVSAPAAMGAIEGESVLLDANENLLEIDNRERAACLLAHRYEAGVSAISQVALYGKVTLESGGLRFHAERGQGFQAPRSAVANNLLVGLLTRLQGPRELKRMGQEVPDIEGAVREARRTQNKQRRGER